MITVMGNVNSSVVESLSGVLLVANMSNNNFDYTDLVSELSKKYNIDIDIFGIPAISIFKFKSKNTKKYITFITQEMLKNKFLANNMVYVSIAHTKEIIDKYLSILEKCFKLISDFEKGNKNIKNYLKSKIFEESFQRLN